VIIQNIVKLHLNEIYADLNYSPTMFQHKCFLSPRLPQPVFCCVFTYHNPWPRQEAKLFCLHCIAKAFHFLSPTRQINYIWKLTIYQLC